MRRLSENQKAFCLVSVILSSTFFYLLTYFLNFSLWSYILPLAIAFGLLMFGNGFIFGYRDNIAVSRADISFRYHWLTYVTVNGVYLVSLLIPDLWKTISYVGIMGQLFFWGIGLIIHYYYSKSSIKGYDPEEIF